MKAVIQRVEEASVKVNQQTVGEIRKGFVVLLGITHEDTQEDIDYLVNKIIHLRVFEDSEERMNLSLIDVKGELLSVSQFTLYSDTRKGRRPSFSEAAKPDHAEPLYQQFNEKIKQAGIALATGIFGEMMSVSLVNDGPVTIIIDSSERKKSK